MATGVLVIGVERATRLLTYVIGSTKRYRATIRLGQTTVTDDADGEVIASASTAGVTEDRVRTGLAALTGEIEQVPSAVSAIKVNGRRAYARVRAGEEVTLAARRVTISRLVLGDLRRVAVDHLNQEHLDLDVDVECSSGTYVRAIARDLGVALAVGGHLTALRRTAVGAFTLAEAQTLAELAGRDDPVTLPLSAAAARFFPRRNASADEARVLGHGGPLDAIGMAGPYAVFGPDGEVVAVVSEHDGRAKSEIVLAPSG
jgi:tRNA pseudouridine55 synthase